MGWKDKTFGYWKERLGGIFGASISGFIVWKYWSDDTILLNSSYYDKLISITSTLFAFLLAILTLIVQSSSETVTEMKKRQSYSRLITYNKLAVYLSITVCLYSFLMCIILLPSGAVCKFTLSYGITTLKFLVSIHTFLTVWMLIDILTFVKIFYLIIQKTQNELK